jgi:hypothetical protein
MAETVAIPCAPDEYTELASGVTMCSMRIRGHGAGRIAVATAQPAANSENYIELRHDQYGFDIGSLEAGDKVFFMPITGASLTLEVLRG